MTSLLIDSLAWFINLKIQNLFEQIATQWHKNDRKALKLAEIPVLMLTT